MITPTGIQVDSDGKLWVVDRGNSRVQKFTRDGEFLGMWGTAGNNQGQFGVPTSIAFDKDGNFYVAEVENSRVQIFSPDGKYLLAEFAQHSMHEKIHEKLHRETPCKNSRSQNQEDHERWR